MKYRVVIKNDEGRRLHWFPLAYETVVREVTIAVEDTREAAEAVVRQFSYGRYKPTIIEEEG